MDDQAIRAEVVRQHRMLADWLGSECDLAVLDALRASHTDDFTMIAPDGVELDRSELVEALALARNAVPGLEIDVTAIEIIAASAETAVVQFRETHRQGEKITPRRTTAVLLRDGEKFRWRHVHETNIS